MFKSCYKCKQELPLDYFYRDRANKDGRGCICIDCKKRYYADTKEKRKQAAHLYYIENKDELELKRKEYCKNNKQKIINKGRRQYAANKTSTNRRHKSHYHKIKNIVFTHYGYECTWCGDTDKDILSIDHIDNSGGVHRKQLKSEGFGTIYQYLLAKNFPQGFQTLCILCNFYKGRTNHFGILPEKRKNLFRINNINYQHNYTEDYSI